MFVKLDGTLVRAILNKAVINENEIDVHVNAINLAKTINTQLNLDLAIANQEILIIKAPLKIRSFKNGTIVINPEEKKEKDPFDLPLDQLKRIVRGIVWRDEHFAGQTIVAISGKVGYSENYVSKCIDDSFNFLSANSL